MVEWRTTEGMENPKTITQNVMPEIRVIDPIARLTKCLHFLFDHLQVPGLSDHANRGGGPALDAALYDDPQQKLW